MNKKDIFQKTAKRPLDRLHPHLKVHHTNGEMFQPHRGKTPYFPSFSVFDVLCDPTENIWM